MLDVNLHRAFGDLQFAGDQLVAVAGGDERQDFLFPLGQPLLPNLPPVLVTLQQGFQPRDFRQGRFFLCPLPRLCGPRLLGLGHQGSQPVLDALLLA